MAVRSRPRHYGHLTSVSVLVVCAPLRPSPPPPHRRAHITQESVRADLVADDGQRSATTVHWTKKWTLNIFMYVWQEFNIEANYNDQATVQVLSIDDRGNYIVKYREKIFKADRNKIKFRKKK